MATINGTSGNDSLNGTSGNDTLNGLGGNDTLAGSAGTDRYDGGTGSDTLDLRLTSTGVTVNFVDGTISGGFTGTFVNMERVLGGNGADNLTGTAGSQNLSARGGNDTLAGGAGVDTLWGGSGADSFTYRETGTANADSIADFASGADKIVLNTVVMGTLGTSGNFAAGDERFVANSSGTAQEADDRVIYETDTRQIWYDPDGTGIAARELIATLQSGATLVATDIVVQGQGSGGGGPTPTVGTEGDDTIDGTAGDDTIDGLGGNDLIRGFEGADSLRGGAGNDTLFAFWELSDFETDAAADTLEGGLGDDFYHVNNDGDVILADPGGIDTVVAYRGADWTLGAGLENLTLESLVADGTGNDLNNVLLSAHEGGSITGLGGNDRLVARGSENSTRLDGGTGNDTLVGAIGIDAYLFSVAPGAANADEITSFELDEDVILLDGAAMPALGSSGRFSAADARYVENFTGTAHDSNDRVIYNAFNGELWYDPDGTGASQRLLIATLQGAPDLAATDIEVINGTAPSGIVINGTSGPDTLAGTAGNDTMNGLEGNDLFLAGSTGGTDVINGGAGRDSIEFKDRATSAIQVDFTVGTITGVFGRIEFTDIERVVAGNFPDELFGDGASQTLTGQGGADTIWSAGGADTLWGGSGGDNFLFRETGTANADRISDFASGSDNFWLDSAAFAAIGPEGGFAAADARFKANSSGTATDTNDRVVFNTSTGQLYYDADGSGAGSAQLIATVQSGASVAATDIVVV